MRHCFIQNLGMNPLNCFPKWIIYCSFLKSNPSVVQYVVLRDELFLALLAGCVLVFGTGHDDLPRVVLFIQKVLERVQVIALVQGWEIGRLHHVSSHITYPHEQTIQCNIEKFSLRKSLFSPSSKLLPTETPCLINNFNYSYD